MAKLLNALKGKKTYILVAVGILCYGTEQMGLIPAGTVDKIDGLLVILGIGTVRSALAQATK